MIVLVIPGPTVQSFLHISAVDCVMGTWSAWGFCSCASGTRTRTRSITTQQVATGAACGATSERQACATGVTCRGKSHGLFENLSTKVVLIPELRCSILQNLVTIWVGVKRDMVLKAILIRTHISIHPPMRVNHPLREWERDSVCTLFLTPAQHLRM